MATGIVSIAAADHGMSALSGVLALTAVAGMPVLMYLTARHWDFDLRDHRVALPLFTYVAACAVLGARFAEHRWALWAVTGMAVQAWLSLRRRPFARCGGIGDRVCAMTPAAGGSWQPSRR
jgi:hypothetical protein